jgi:hypothetical protein
MEDPNSLEIESSFSIKILKEISVCRAPKKIHIRNLEVAPVLAHGPFIRLPIPMVPVHILEDWPKRPRYPARIEHGVPELHGEEGVVSYGTGERDGGFYAPEPFVFAQAGHVVE